MLHHMTLTKIPFEKIASGEKIIESRLYDEKRQQINIGDQIEFSNVDDVKKKVLVRVVALHRHETFEELFSIFPCEYFGGESKNELIDEIGKFYSKSDQEKWGVVGVRIELVK